MYTSITVTVASQRISYGMQATLRTDIRLTYMTKKVRLLFTTTANSGDTSAYLGAVETLLNVALNNGKTYTFVAYANGNPAAYVIRFG